LRYAGSSRDESFEQGDYRVASFPRNKDVSRVQSQKYDSSPIRFTNSIRSIFAC